MTRKRKKLDPRIEKQMEEYATFRKKLEDLRPVILNPSNLTEKERLGYIDWLVYCLRSTDAFVDAHLTPQQREAKYMCSPQVEKELQDIDAQIVREMERLKHLEGKEITEEELFLAESKVEQLLYKKYDVMEQRGSSADKAKARAYKQARKSVMKDLAH